MKIARMLAAVFAPTALAFAAPPGAIIRDLTHHSAVFSEERNFRIFLPPDYDSRPERRYAVVYFFHGWGERYNQSTDEVKNYDCGTDYGGDTIASFVGTHDVIVVKWDGFNPRREGEKYPRPYNIGPVETSRQFPFYFLELVEYIDSHFRTIANRGHRAVSGVSMGGFMALWIGGKFPDLVGSVSSFMPAPEYYVGPRAFPAEYRHVDMYPNYDGVRVRLVTGSRDFLRWYHRRMNAVWDFVRPDYEHEDFDSAHGTPGMAKTLAFHMNAFRKPLPAPDAWRHWDVYPAFDVWGWSVRSDRHEPGFTVLENVSRDGFRSSVREWAPSGPLLSSVALEVSTAALYVPSASYDIVDENLDTGFVVRGRQRADAAGKLHFKLDGARHEVGISSAPKPVLTISGVRIEGAPRATDGEAFRLVLSVLNKGAGRAKRITASIDGPARTVRVPDLAPGKQARAAFDLTIAGSHSEMRGVRVRLTADGTATEIPVEFAFFRRAPELENTRLFDGSEAAMWIQGDKRETRAIGSGNADGVPQPGETFGIGVADGGAYRLAELFTDDACVDNASRITDIWREHEGLIAHYSLPRIRPGCPGGHEIPFFARWVVPNGHEHILHEGTVRIRVAGGR